jgi:glycosyltransferase involved in cell wall biosynthesis
MRIAFVNQPIDVILPPYQNSVGACTYGSACALAASNDVTVYGMQQRNQVEPEVVHRGVHFRFLPCSTSDRMLQSLRNKYSKLVQPSSPISTSRLLFPDYGRRVAKELRKAQFDVIHIQHSSQYVPVIRRLNPNAKIVLHLHAEWFSQSRPSRLTRRLKDLDLLTTVSNHITRKIQQQIPTLADHCETIYNGINDHEFSAERDYSASKGSRPRRIMYAGGISPHKGIHVLIDAFHIVAERHPDVRLDVVGPHGSYPLEETFDLEDWDLIKGIAPFYRADLITLIKRKVLGGQPCPDSYVAQLESRISGAAAGRVAFLGIIPRPELVQRYYEADVFVFPPIWDEGFGIPPIEAMAAGAAVVASRSGALVETIVHGETGLLVEKNDPQALADAISELLADDPMRERMGQAGRRKVLESFTWNRIAAKTDREYQRLCSIPNPQLQGAGEELGWSMNVFRSLWLLSLLAFALCPWILKSRLGINGPHHNAWHLISFFFTAIVLSDVVEDRRANRNHGCPMLHRRMLQVLIPVLAAVLSEGLEMLRYHIHFEWSDIVMDLAGIALGCALAWQLPTFGASFLPRPRERSR